MQIHDLNTKALTNPAYVAFDDGTDTYKADFKAEIDNAAADAVADADLTDNTVAFTSGDAVSPTAWTAVDVLTSGLAIKTLFNRISTMIKNVRWLYSKLGTTDISSIGNGTVTGALSTLNSKQILHKTVTGTSNSNGDISLGVNGYEYVVIGAACTSKTRAINPYIYYDSTTHNWWATVTLANVLQKNDPGLVIEVYYIPVIS